MGTDNMTLGPGIFYDGSGKPIGTCQGPDDVDTIYPDPVYDEFLWTKYDETPVVTLSEPHSFECEWDATVDFPLINELIGELSKPQPFYMEYDGVRYEQIRKHKKKRINKKWAKRYGYREVPCRYRMENAYIRQRTFNDFSIVADPPKIICSNLYGRFGG